VNLEPLVGAILGVWLLHEVLGITSMAGGALLDRVNPCGEPILDRQATATVTSHSGSSCGATNWQEKQLVSHQGTLDSVAKVFLCFWRQLILCALVGHLNCGGFAVVGDGHFDDRLFLSSQPRLHRLP
jgi:hypothetical protein